MKLSVVTSVWNRAATIGDAIKSVQAQDYPNIEHVIQDGGSTDGTLDVIRDLAPDTALVSERDKGIYDGINRGIARATGDVIGVMHSDDYFADESVLSRVAALLEDPAVDGVYADLDYVSATDPEKVIRRWVSGDYSRQKLGRGWMPPHPTLYLRRAVFETHGTYDTAFQIAADYDAMLRYLMAGTKLAYDPHVAVKMRVGGESNASLKKILRKSQEDYQALRRNHVGGIGALAVKNFSKLTQFAKRA